MSESSGESKILNTGPSPRGWHRLQLAAECLQKYAWTYEAPGGPPDISKKPPLAKGTLIHLALAQHYARMKAGLQPYARGLADLANPEDDWCDPEEAVLIYSQVKEIDQYAQLAIDSYRAYVNNYFSDSTTWKILAVEHLMDITIAGKYRLTGRADLVIEDMGGRIWIVDHKTTGRLTRSHKEFYAVSGQLLGYQHMGKKIYGDKCSGLIVNLIQHTKPKFERITLPRSPNLEQRFERTIVDIEESIERIKLEGRDYDDWPKAMNELSCFSRYGACPFIDKCRWGASAKKAGNWTWED